VKGDDSSMEENNSNQSPPTKSSKKSVIIISIAALIIIAALGVVIWYLIVHADAPESNNGRGVVATPDNIDELLEREPETPKPEDSYTTQMTTSWNFKSSTEPSENAYVRNYDDNPCAVYFDVAVLENEEDTEGRKVYSSPYLLVGEEIRNIALEEKLAPGDYNAILTYHLVDEKNDFADLDREVNVAITLHVQS